MTTTRVLRTENVTQKIMDDPTAVTAAWVDLTPVLNVKHIEALAIWSKLTINDSKNVRFRAVALPDSESIDEYDLPIQTVDPDIVRIKPEFFELEDDINQNITFQVSLGDLISYIKIQTQAGTVGATAGVVEELLASIKLRGD